MGRGVQDGGHTYNRGWCMLMYGKNHHTHTHTHTPHFPFQGIFLTQRSDLSPALAGGFFTTEPPGKPKITSRDHLSSPYFKTSFDITDLLQASTSSFVEALLLLVIDKGRTYRTAGEKRFNSCKSCVGFFHWKKKKKNPAILPYFVPTLCQLTIKSTVYHGQAGGLAHIWT